MPDDEPPRPRDPAVRLLAIVLVAALVLGMGSFLATLIF